MSPAPSDSSRSWSSMLTWRAHDARRMESVRVQLSGKRIKANGRIVAAATDTNPAFAAYYDLYTDETGATKRLGMTVTVAERERQLVVARDEENMWLITDHRGESRSAYDGALDVDVVFSPFFNALPIRRCGLNERADTITVPTIYVTLPDMSIASAPVSYSSAEPGAGEGIKVHSPVSETTLTVDDDGFIVDYPSVAERI
ncbi:MAG: putative glycolipid-binding domain-containing protein [Mycobacterium sp.]